MKIKTDFQSSNRVRNQLRALVAAKREIVDPILWKWIQATRMVLVKKPYPPKPIDSKYIRTGHLKRRFAGVRISEAYHQIVNRAAYASYVIGNDDQQAYMHKPGYKMRKGWWQMEDVITEETPKLRANIERGLRVWRD